jgi:Cu-Zn family superoxide dismutase
MNGSNETLAAIACFDPNASSNPGKLSGTVRFYQEDLTQPTFVHIQLHGLPPWSKRGIHIHRLGDLTKGCDSCCQHWNPEGRMHGSNELTGLDRHHGDMLNNIIADKNKIVDISYCDYLIDLSGPYSIIGRSVVVHEKADDLGIYRDENSARGKLSRETGDAGKRVACAVIGITDPGEPKCLRK